VFERIVGRLMVFGLSLIFSSKSLCSVSRTYLYHMSPDQLSQILNSDQITSVVDLEDYKNFVCVYFNLEFVSVDELRGLSSSEILEKYKVEVFDKTNMARGNPTCICD
jgi:hypothetical protein